jgi:hypothetical protein
MLSVPLAIYIYSKGFPFKGNVKVEVCLLNDEQTLNRAVGVKAMLVPKAFLHVQQFYICKMPSTFSQNIYFKI